MNDIEKNKLTSEVGERQKISASSISLKKVRTLYSTYRGATAAPPTIEGIREFYVPGKGWNKNVFGTIDEDAVIDLIEFLYNEQDATHVNFIVRTPHRIAEPDYKISGLIYE